jgi:ribosomal-protein-alanine N-acetyltransferase
MIFRRALSSDVGKLFELENKLFKEENFPLARQSFYYHIRRNLLYVAQSEEGDIVGYILALTHYKHAKIYSLGVNAAYRGRGISKSLMRKILEALHSKGFEHCLLEVRCDNNGAIALYRKFGFKTIKTLTSFYRDGCDAYLMES